MTPLPRLMAAPNGARRTKADHPAFPMTDAELVETALSCQSAGADGLHIHIRDENGEHDINADHYRAVVDQLKQAVPNMYLQGTSESAGRFSGDEQRAMMRDLQPTYVSAAMREMVREPADWGKAQDFYEWALTSGVEIQHILYSPSEVRCFVEAIDANRIPGKKHLIQLVQGTYANGSADSVPLAHYLDEMKQADGAEFDWMLCAFGADETGSVTHASKMGGKARVGFENSLWHADGSMAVDNAARVREVDTALRAISKSR